MGIIIITGKWGEGRACTMKLVLASKTVPKLSCNCVWMDLTSKLKSSTKAHYKIANTLYKLAQGHGSGI